MFSKILRNFEFLGSEFSFFKILLGFLVNELSQADLWWFIYLQLLDMPHTVHSANKATLRAEHKWPYKRSGWPYIRSYITKQKSNLVWESQKLAL